MRAPALAFILFPSFVAAAPASSVPTVVVSVAPLAEVVSRLAGDAVEIVALIPPGTDVETFSPTAQQMAALERATVVVRVGHPAFALEASVVDPWLSRRRGIALVALADHVRGAPGSSPARSHHRTEDDPHLWLSPRIVRAAAGELAVRLARRIPAESDAIRRRAVALEADIAGLEERLAARVGGRGGRFLIDHPSLGHFAADFGLEQIAVEQDGKEPSPAQLARLIARGRRDKFRFVIVQRSVARRAAEVLAREIGAERIEIDPLAVDWLANMERIGEAVARALVRE